MKFHPAIQKVLRFFEYAHLPKNLQEVSKQFHDLAYKTAETNPDSAETTVALRKLLEAKDAAVRAAIETKDDVQKAAEAGFKSNTIGG